MNGGQHSILVVDDELLNIALILRILKGESCRISTAVNGEEAWGLLEKSPEGFDAVLLDRMMPGIDGLEVLRRMKAHPRLKAVPVILQTAMVRENEVLEGIQAGAFYYLSKPYRKEKLLAVVKAAFSDRDRYKSLHEEDLRAVDALSLMMRGDFEVRHIDEADALAALLAGMCPGPDKVELGLRELIMNAVEHGSLGITYEDKAGLVLEGAWREEVNRRALLPGNSGKKVLVRYERSCSEITFTIEDMGPGFDWEPFLSASLERVDHTHGRGIAIAANYSFGSIEYIGKGNIVKAIVRLLP